MRTRLSLAAVGLAAAIIETQAQASSLLPPAVTCESLKAATLLDTRITDAVTVTPSTKGQPGQLIGGITMGFETAKGAAHPRSLSHGR
jgi:hypothetical protein